MALQATAAGHFELDLGRALVSLDAVAVQALDYREAAIEPKSSHASLSRVLPEGLGGETEKDREALHFLLVAPAGLGMETVQVLTRGIGQQPLDVIPQLRLRAAACPSGTAPELVCRATPAIRAVADALDRGHPRVRERSVRAEVGGTLELAFAGRTLSQLRVGGPRVTRFGPIERLRAKLRLLVLRARPGGIPALGGTDKGARELVRREVLAAAGLWGQCGIEFGPPEQLSIEIVDPPPARLLAVGCGFGQRASGGLVRLRAGGRVVELPTRAGESPVAVAQRLSVELERVGQAASAFENQRALDEAVPTADLLLTGTGVFEAAGQPLSTDPTLTVCLGEVDLGDGLTHFGDGDAFTGTLEERALLRAFDDGDPSSIEVLIIPTFARSSRIGESFMLSGGSSLSNAVIIDRAAIQAGARSFALAHELGHVLLAMPGHPDDFGVDQPWTLMDADVADPTLFGPRRLSIAECERALIESGPNANVPLLRPVPLH